MGKYTVNVYAGSKYAKGGISVYPYYVQTKSKQKAIALVKKRHNKSNIRQRVRTIKVVSKNRR